MALPDKPAYEKNELQARRASLRLNYLHSHPGLLSGTRTPFLAEKDN
jgi:hypothetical protein